MALENLYNVHDGLTGRFPGIYLDVNQIKRHQERYGKDSFPPEILVTERELRATYNPTRGSFNPGDGVTITVDPIAHRDTETGAITAAAPADRATAARSTDDESYTRSTGEFEANAVDTDNSPEYYAPADNEGDGEDTPTDDPFAAVNVEDDNTEDSKEK